MGREAVMLRSTAMISLLFLISWPSAFAAGEQGFSIKVFTSPDDQFWANSVIIEGAREVMLVDGQLKKTSAEKVLQEIRETKKPLSIIYVTHEHADHFLGLEVFKEAYPRVRIIANSAVVDRINKVYREKIVEVTRFCGHPMVAAERSIVDAEEPWAVPTGVPAAHR